MTIDTARYVNMCGGNAFAIQHRVVHRPLRLLSGYKASVHCSGGRSANRRRENKGLNKIVYCYASV